MNQGIKGIVSFRHREVIGRAGDDLKHQHRVGSSLMKLAPRMEEARTETQSSPNAKPLLNQSGNSLESFSVVSRRIDIGLHDDVVARFFLGQPRCHSFE